VRKGDRLDRAGTEAAARRLIELGVRAWVVLHFPEGSCACSRQGEIVWQGSLQVPRSAIRGAAGAGDAFAAGVLLGWHNGHDFLWNLKLGVGAAAACLRDPTCSGSIPSLAEIDALARSRSHWLQIGGERGVYCTGTFAWQTTRQVRFGQLRRRGGTSLSFGNAAGWIRP
jgi:hypothetical protein